MKKIVPAVLLAVLVLCLVIIIYQKQALEPITTEPVPSPPTTAGVSPAPVATPTPTPSPTPTPTPTPSPSPDIPEIDIDSWEYTLANTDNKLESTFVPEVTLLESNQYFDSRAVGALQEFIAAARADGLSVYLTSSYRSYSTQQYLFNNKVAQYGGDEATAARIVATPGSSEHQTGLAADIVDKYYEYLNESLADTDLSKWMKAHCHEYGFILRFPEDKQDITGIMFEPWHFRYVGVEAATYIMEKGICLEEFVELYE